MKFTCERSDLQAATATASKAASARSPMPALEGLLLEAQPESLKLTGYDLKKGIYTKIAAQVTEQGSIVLNARMFSNIVNSLPDGTVKVPAAWLIDSLGFRGAVRGGAKVYDKQPLVIVNESGSASPEEIMALEQEIITKVWETYGIELHPEVEHI